MLHGDDLMPGPADTCIAYGQGWGNVSKTPFREYKHSVHEGGVATPLIAHWPQLITRKGELEKRSGHLVDLMATCVDVAGAQYPQQADGQPITPTEGRSLLPTFEGKSADRDAIYCEHEGNRACVRAGGNWSPKARPRNGNHTTPTPTARKCTTAPPPTRSGRRRLRLRPLRLPQTPARQPDEPVDSAGQRRFGADKSDTLPDYCRRCEARFACNGECPKHRFIDTPDGEPGLNYLCGAYKQFFGHIDPYLRTMVRLLHNGRPPAEIMRMIAAPHRA